MKFFLQLLSLYFSLFFAPLGKFFLVIKENCLDKILVLIILSSDTLNKPKRY